MPHHSHWENRWTALGLGHSWSISPLISITLLWHLYRAFVSLECHALPSWRSAQWLPAGHQLFRYPVGDYVLHRKITGSNLWQCDNVTMCCASQFLWPCHASRADIAGLRMLFRCVWRHWARHASFDSLNFTSKSRRLARRAKIMLLASVSLTAFKSSSCTHLQHFANICHEEATFDVGWCWMVCVMFASCIDQELLWITDSCLAIKSKLSSVQYVCPTFTKAVRN